jgi:magnesium and cobalt transporter
VARDVMQPREAIEFMPLDVPIHLAAQHAARAGHTRLPVCEPEGGLDAPWGLVHVHDLLAAVLREPAGDLRSVLRPLPRVPDEMPVTALLHRMREEGRQMALVTDDDGRTVGLVTLEDLLEELVGEIEEEPALDGLAQ